MIVQNIHLLNWDWSCKIFYAVDDYYIDEIIEELDYLDCPEEELIKIEKAFVSLIPNYGITYSNFKEKKSIMVIGITTCPAEFQNTFDHEKGHLAKHIAEALDIDPFGEEYQYLTGEIGKLMFPIAKRFLCEHCRKDLLSR